MLDFLLVFGGLIVVSGIMYGLATFVFGRGEELAPMPADVTPMLLPEHRAVEGSDVRAVRLPVTVRGYRMSEVDELLDRVADELDRARRLEPVSFRPPEDERLADERDLEGARAEPYPPAEVDIIEQPMTGGPAADDTAEVPVGPDPPPTGPRHGADEFDEADRPGWGPPPPRDPHRP